MINKPTNFNRSLTIVNVLSLIVFVFILTGCGSSKSKKAESIKSPEKSWVGTWSTAPQLVEPHNNPPEPGLSNNTIRQIVRVSIGGEDIRLRFSNEFSKSPVTLKTVQVAVSTGGSTVDSTTIKTLKFDNKEEVIMNPGEAITSDAFSFDLKPRMDISITIYFGETSADVTGHPGSRTTSYILTGNKTSSTNFKDAIKTDHWYVINGIDVLVSNASAIAIIGNSITDGRGSGTNKQNRWPDILSERLLKNQNTKNTGVLNMGIGGNAVLKGGLGPTALDRFQRDVLNQHGVKWLIILEGVNDLGGTPNAEAANKVATGLIAAYEKMIDLAHAKNIKVYGATILPITKSFYYKDYREVARNTINDWIRNSGKFDAVIDFDKAMRDPNEPSTLLPDLHTGDYLHPNEAGYVMMGETVDLSLFE
ncbi:SGNH/GDSL hydrolase family protein [Flaviramulus sp. BrNp1-15]|uniref:SGNH/GDSL hydrolase family protein n=1 Tax=Flaviramulus sp. BrNp1-15 TaxID=2916754 RepID=UPI001EE97E3E|nr:SGNH/GDSL hydrolase family protein [Flaviramulus sp. BrNp1-15]ULC60831.1 SGNH/GDSL hydrolase family protein [Flaviramulus sp. BrNp1-15]